MDTPDPTPTAALARRQWRGGASPVKRAFIVDRRFRPARRLTALTDGLCRELGRPLADLGESQRSQVALAANLMLAAEELHASAAAGKPVAADELVRVSGALSRLLDDLGLSPAAVERRRAADEQHKRPAGALGEPRLRIFITPDDVGHICSAPVAPVEGQEDVAETVPAVQFIIDDTPT